MHEAQQQPEVAEDNPQPDKQKKPSRYKFFAEVALKNGQIAVMDSQSKAEMKALLASEEVDRIIRIMKGYEVTFASKKVVQF